MSAVCHNLRGGLWSRSAFLIAVASCGALALAGVTLRPALAIFATRGSIEHEEQRVRECIDLRRRVEGFEAAGGPALAGDALARLSRVLPRDVGAIEVFSLLRLCARAADFEITSLGVGVELDLGLQGSEDRVVMLELFVAGEGGLTSLPRLVELLEAQGYPLAVLDLAMQKSVEAKPGFTFRTTLGALYYAPLSLAPATWLPEEGGTP